MYISIIQGQPKLLRLPLWNYVSSFKIIRLITRSIVLKSFFLTKILRLNKPCSGLRLSWHFTSRRNQLLAAVHSGRRKECTVMSSLFNIIQSFRGRGIGKQGINSFYSVSCVLHLYLIIKTAEVRIFVFWISGLSTDLHLMQIYILF